ncbi:aminotransferase class I/II-fold pyridoxal phosphate-dependent enzyme [Pseudoteredinibacter isoporae]|uniref:aminotransferase class I/II-fold pyridoxal phosphate-dependent enzyme n=1 Tax=Pseudoteredinibacter isoporae TaxID=570281 RepID=UPI003106ED4A
MDLNQASQEQLQQWQTQLQQEFENFKTQGLQLDITRGKPSSEQLDLSNQLDGILAGHYNSSNGTDVRNYGGLDGLPEMKQLGADILSVPQERILVGGNSSLTLMFQAMMQAYFFGYAGPESAWQQQDNVKFLCPVPGYDRHFAICEHFGIEMLTVSMNEDGPDMDQVETLIKADPSIKGMWCVPKYSNPTGTVYSAATIERIAKLGQIAGEGFRVFWDNAYVLHDLNANAPALASIADYCQQHGTEDSVLQFASTSKVSFAGAGVAFMAASPNNLAAFKQTLSIASIGPDKVNQLRHAKLFPDLASLKAHMMKHADLLRPRFEVVLNRLEEAFGDNDLGQWQSAAGGYFVSFDTRPGLAKRVVDLAAEAGVKLTPAGATYPYGSDPQNSNIRIAPSVPTVDDVDLAMQVFVCAVKLASVEQALAA